MRTRQGRPVQYTDDMIEEAVSDLCRATGNWPSVRSVKERLGGGTDKRIKAVLDRLRGDARDDRGGPSPMAAPAADPAAILGVLGSDALSSQVLTVLKTCIAGLAEVAQSHVDARIAASQEAAAAALEKKVEYAVETAMSDERRKREALEVRLSQIELTQQRTREALSSVAGDLTRVVKPMGRIVRTIGELAHSLPAGVMSGSSRENLVGNLSGAEVERSRRSGGTVEPMADASPTAHATPPANAASRRRIDPAFGDDRTTVTPSRARAPRSSSGEGDRGARRGEVPRGAGEALPCPGPASSGGSTSAAVGLAGSSADVPVGRPGWAAGAAVYGRDAGLEPGPAGPPVTLGRDG